MLPMISIHPQVNIFSSKDSDSLVPLPILHDDSSFGEEAEQYDISGSSPFPYLVLIV
jgi:hypothetical protein